MGEKSDNNKKPVFKKRHFILFRCNEHGQCKNGTCLCVTGYNGRHCTLEGCLNGCSGHGQCRASGSGSAGAWECRCYDGWDGPDCNIPVEQVCNDGRDNDKGDYSKLRYSLETVGFLFCSEISTVGTLTCFSLHWESSPLVIFDVC